MSYNLPARWEFHIQWDVELEVGDWVLCTITRRRGVITSFFYKKGKIWARLEFVRRKNFVRKFRRPIKCLVKIENLTKTVGSNAWVWPELNRKKVNMAKFFRCTKLDQYVAEGACVRRVQVKNLFPKCQDCDFSPLIVPDEDDKVKLRKSAAQIVYSDPPPHPTLGNKYPANVWKSGKQLKRSGLSLSGSPKAHNMGVETSKAVPRASKIVAKPKKKKVVETSTSSLINQEVKKLKKKKRWKSANKK